jgi:hypothetical protein
MMVMMVRTWRTGPAIAHGRQALLMCLEPATRETARGIVMSAPVCASAGFAMQTMAVKTPKMNSKGLTAASLVVH